MRDKKEGKKKQARSNKQCTVFIYICMKEEGRKKEASKVKQTMYSITDLSRHVQRRVQTGSAHLMYWAGQ